MEVIFSSEKSVYFPQIRWCCNLEDRIVLNGLSRDFHKDSSSKSAVLTWENELCQIGSVKSDPHYEYGEHGTEKFIKSLIR
jgi:hypothetical protein